MSFGGDVITFKHLQKAPSPDEQGNYQMVEVPTAAPGCRHRPLTFTEVVELQFDVATEMWRSTIPLFEYDDATQTTVMAAKVNDIIGVDGKDYQIVGGVRPFKDMEGRPYKMTILSKLQHG